MAKFVKGATVVLFLTTLMVACSGGGLVPSVEAVEEPKTPVELEEITITTVILYTDDVSRGVSEVNVTCLEGCEGQREDTTDGQGAVTFTGVAPLTIRAEKSGYIPAEQEVSDGSRVAMSDEWPPETKEAIRQLGLAEVIASGDLLLAWDDDYFIPKLSEDTGNDGLGGLFSCLTINGEQVPILVVREIAWRGRDFMLATLVHEAVHAWQGLMSNNPPCGVSEWTQSESGLSWIAATEKDLEEVGIIPDYDDDTSYGRPLIEVPWESQATFYSDWYTGTLWWGGVDTTREEFYQLAPNRSRYVEEHFGPPGPWPR